MDSAKHLVERHAAALASRPVWLFSSGPIGDPPKPEEDPADIAEIMATTRARQHRLFAGKVDKAVLGLGEKVILKAVQAPEGGFRSWDDVRSGPATSRQNSARNRHSRRPEGGGEP